MSQERSGVIILGDTNVAYKLFFFMDKGVLGSIDIFVDSLGKLKFHPIVKEEVETHIEASRVLREYDYKNSHIPEFFKKYRQRKDK